MRLLLLPLFQCISFYPHPVHVSFHACVPLCFALLDHALIGGSVAAYITTRSNISNAIAGVAIAVALVPPLCVGGIGLTLSQELNSSLGTLTSQDMLYEITCGSLLLFSCNFVGIVAAGVITYLSQSIGSWKRSVLPLSLLFFLSVLIACKSRVIVLRLYHFRSLV